VPALLAEPNSFKFQSAPSVEAGRKLMEQARADTAYFVFTAYRLLPTAYSLHIEQLDLEEQGGVAGNGSGEASGAIAQVGRDQ